MRLRPSGRQGPVATSLAAFESYQRTEAWTWEHLALTRARTVAGAPATGAAAEAVRAEILAAPRDTEATLLDVRDMRARLSDAAPPRGVWDAKRGPGRIQDIELLAETAALLAGAPARSPADQLRAGAKSGWLAASDAAMLTETHLWLTQLQSAARLLTGAHLEFDDLGEDGRAFILSQTGARDGADLAQDLVARTAAADAIVTAALDASFEEPPSRKQDRDL